MDYYYVSITSGYQDGPGGHVISMFDIRRYRRNPGKSIERIKDPVDNINTKEKLLENMHLLDKISIMADFLMQPMLLGTYEISRASLPRYLDNCHTPFFSEFFSKK